MSEDRAEPCIKHEQMDLIRIRLMEQKPGKKDRECRFPGISDQRDHARLHPEIAECIGHPDVAASFLADIHTFTFCIQITGGKPPQNITDRK